MSRHASSGPQGSPTPEEARMSDDRKVVPITPLQPVERSKGHATSARGSFDTDKFEQMWTIAERMANMTVVPLSLRSETGPDGKLVPLTLGQIVANCAKVVNQADAWGLSPFGVLDEASIVTDADGERHMVYGGKVIMAALEAKGVLLDYHVAGEGDMMHVVAKGPRSDGTEVEVKGNIGKWATPRWKPELFHNMLIYRAAREWARLYKPAIMLGVYTADEIETVTPARGKPPARPSAPAAPAIKEPTTSPPRRLANDVPAREPQAEEAPPASTLLPSGNVDSNTPTTTKNVSREMSTSRKAIDKGLPKPLKGKTPRPPADANEDRIWLDGFKTELDSATNRAHLERIIARRQKAMGLLGDAARLEANRAVEAALKQHPDQ
jgi:hypothetical protein